MIYLDKDHWLILIYEQKLEQMKRKIIVIGIVFLSYLSGFSQLNVSTNLRSDYSYDQENEEWELISTDEEDLTFFEFNEDFTFVKHTTPTITSAYLIKSFEIEGEGEEEQYIFEIVSDVGNKYVMILSLGNEMIAFLYNDGSHMVTHDIKSSWFDE